MASINGKINNRSQERGLDRGDVDSSVGNYVRGKNWAKAGMLGAGLCLLVGGAGCGLPNSPLGLLPRIAQPGFYRDYKDEQERKRLMIEYGIGRYTKLDEGAWRDHLTGEIIISKEKHNY